MFRSYDQRVEADKVATETDKAWRQHRAGYLSEAEHADLRSKYAHGGIIVPCRTMRDHLIASGEIVPDALTLSRSEGGVLRIGSPCLAIERTGQACPWLEEREEGPGAALLH